MSRHRKESSPARGRWLSLAGACLVTALVVGLGIAAVQERVTVPRIDDGVAPASMAEGVLRLPDSPQVAREVVLEHDPEVLPPDSGEGYRVVFSQDQQRVWLVEADGTVRRTYPVSGSVYDNLAKGTYAVFSRSEKAYGIEDSGTMNWFVRFARGERAAIGFHDIPVHRGEPVQGVAELGTPLSHGCIRQDADDARALWDFAPIGTPVIVV
ncbi:L,D-transpeptidase [Nocardioides sp. AE5]|uniref:L,D-transpeptidase n=1 Tax=Nocardioides sp. AE5 TaxID=2962573 RepID=UPI002881014C|nr:L,D-transpeptidase [Nocardioides sp. AE5]MDT0202075.1 L,D-transpeptidase [Nocardioides sp. AE5]